jgi:hypothetical protein
MKANPFTMGRIDKVSFCKYNLWGRQVLALGSEIGLLGPGFMSNDHKRPRRNKKVEIPKPVPVFKYQYRDRSKYLANGKLRKEIG